MSLTRFPSQVLGHYACSSAARRGSRPPLEDSFGLRGRLDLLALLAQRTSCNLSPEYGPMTVAVHSETDVVAIARELEAYGAPEGDD